MFSGDAPGLANVRSPAYGPLSERGWWPASGEEWLRAKSHSYWGPADVGLTSNDWSSFPEPLSPASPPLLMEMEDAEALINFPSFLSHPAVVKGHVRKGGPPPPPPQAPESSWGSGKGRANVETSSSLWSARPSKKSRASN